MKYIVLLIGVFFIGAAAQGQDGYAGIHSTTIIDKGTTATSFGFNAGYRLSHSSAGMIADFYLKDKFGIAALDLRYYLHDRPRSFYLSLQPGYTLYGKTTNGITVNGHIAGGAAIGYEYRKKELGVVVSAGWQYYSFKVLKQKADTHAGKVTISLIL